MGLSLAIYETGGLTGLFVSCIESRGGKNRQSNMGQGTPPLTGNAFGAPCREGPTNVCSYF